MAKYLGSWLAIQWSRDLDFFYHMIINLCLMGFVQGKQNVKKKKKKKRNMPHNKKNNNEQQMKIKKKH